ncbi:Cas10/Cmr2 second palm domain-containing protein [Microbacterium sp.]|uniref:Cas10/Cmr2 second palm domain-containing protein n=1 Tax=Microbacterium sp. TaxID=51671 RepID=UPI0039E66715
MSDRDLVVLGISGVQRYIAESRGTADLANASAIMTMLAAAGASYVHGLPDVQLVLPHTDALTVGNDETRPVPNRIVARVPAGEGVDAAKGAEVAIRETWKTHLALVATKTLGYVNVDDFVADTPGLPDVRWVVVPADQQYEKQWREAGRAFGALKRSAPFPQIGGRTGGSGRLCDLSRRWLAVEPPKTPKHSRGKLSVANWAKRVGLDEKGEERLRFPSTRSVASAHYRKRLIELVESDEGVREHLTRLHQAVRDIDCSLERPVGGMPEKKGLLADWISRGSAAWLSRDDWDAATVKRRHPLDDTTDGEKKRDQAVTRGADAIRELRARLGKQYPGLGRPPVYLAIVAQDIDSLGERLSAHATPQEHSALSQSLSELAGKFRDDLETADLLATVVYAGGDDLLFLVPAKSALAAAKVARTSVDALTGPGQGLTASTAIVFFHEATPFSGVVQEAQRLLEQAKKARVSKDALGVAFRWHSGATREVILPWRASTDAWATDILGRFADGPARIVSPSFMADIDRDADELLALWKHHEESFQLEVARLADRHATGDPTAVKALVEAVAVLNRELEDGSSPIPLTDALKIAFAISREVR